MSTSDSKDDQKARAMVSLDGLSVGDAFGQLLSACARSARDIVKGKQLPLGPWWHTDDTQMAMAIVEELVANGEIVPDSLGGRFAKRFQADPGRGYGRGVRKQLEEILLGSTWQETSASAFNGKGSMGNGSAMRSAPVGAWFANDLDRVIEQSMKSAVVTHSHPEGVAGSVAVSLAAAVAWQSRNLPVKDAQSEIWDAVLKDVPQSATLDGIRKARLVPPEMPSDYAARILGSGFLVTAPDTVPFALYCAIRHVDDYREALIATLEGDGDCDTNCAIVGGIVALRTGRQGIPAEWMASRERLDLFKDFDHA